MVALVACVQITKYVDQNYEVNVLQKGPRKSAFLNAFYKGEI
jgi:hypothetical protein